MNIIKTVEVSFDDYLKEHKYTFATDNDKRKAYLQLANIIESSDVKCDEVTVDLQTYEKNYRSIEQIGTGYPQEFTNEQYYHKDYDFNHEVQYAFGSESSETIWSGWSTSAELSGSYCVFGVTAGAKGVLAYKKGKSTLSKTTKNTTVTQHFNGTFFMPSRTQRMVSPRQKRTVFQCNVKDIQVIFKKKSRINCRVITPDKKRIKKSFKLQEILKDHITGNEKGQITIQMNGQFIWWESCTYLALDDPVPLPPVV